MDRDAPVGFKAIRLAFGFETDAPEEAVAQLIKRTGRYCVVYQTIGKRPELQVTVNRGP